MSKALLEQQRRRAMDGSQSQGVYLEPNQVNKKKHLKGADLSPGVDRKVTRQLVTAQTQQIPMIFTVTTASYLQTGKTSKKYKWCHVPASANSLQ